MIVRKHIHIKNSLEASKFACKMQEYKTDDIFILENKSGNDSVNPNSYLGVLYFVTYWTDEIYLANLTSDSFPEFIREYEE